MTDATTYSTKVHFWRLKNAVGEEISRLQTKHEITQVFVMLYVTEHTNG